MEDNPIRVLVMAPLGVGGVSSIMINVQKLIDRQLINFDYLVYHDRKEPGEEEVFRLGSKKYIVSSDNVRIKPFRIIVRCYKIYKICKSNDIKIFHLNAAAAEALTYVIAARLGGVKYVTFHSHNGGMAKKGGYMYWMSKVMKPLMKPLTNNRWACSDLAARFSFPRNIIAKHDYEMIPNGIHLSDYEFNEQIRNEVRIELGIDNKFVVGHVGRFNIQKNHMFLLEIFKAVHHKNHDAILLLFGTGELFDTVKERAIELGINASVIFYGNSNQMPRMWQAMDVFVMPSLYEGLPVSGIEAQASGLPIVMSDTITKEVKLTPKVDFLSLNDDIQIWADTVLKYTDNCTRKSGCVELRNAGYDVENMAKKFEDLYLTVNASLKRN